MRFVRKKIQIYWLLPCISTFMFHSHASIYIYIKIHLDIFILCAACHFVISSSPRSQGMQAGELIKRHCHATWISFLKRFRMHNGVWKSPLILLGNHHIPHWNCQLGCFSHTHHGELRTRWVEIMVVIFRPKIRKFLQVSPTKSGVEFLDVHPTFEVALIQTKVL